MRTLLWLSLWLGGATLAPAAWHMVELTGKRCPGPGTDTNSLDYRTHLGTTAWWPRQFAISGYGWPTNGGAYQEIICCNTFLVLSNNTAPLGENWNVVARYPDICAVHTNWPVMTVKLTGSDFAPFAFTNTMHLQQGYIGGIWKITARSTPALDVTQWYQAEPTRTRPVPVYPGPAIDFPPPIKDYDPFDGMIKNRSSIDLLTVPRSTFVVNETTDLVNWAYVTSLVTDDEGWALSDPLWNFSEATFYSITCTNIPTDP